MADRGLTPTQRFGEVTSTNLPLGNAGDQTEKPKANRVSESFEVAGECLSLTDRKSLIGHRDTTAGIHVHQRHANTLTTIDMMI